MSVRVRAQAPQAAQAQAARPVRGASSALSLTPLLTQSSGPELPIIAVVVTKRPQFAAHVGRVLGWQKTKPAAVVVCTAVAGYDIGPIVVASPGIVVHLLREKDVPLGALRNLAMGFASSCVGLPGNEAILATVDDDDLYGVDYFAGIVDAFQRCPEALVVGQARYGMMTCAVVPETPPAELVKQDVRKVGNVPGATISIRASVWRERQYLRYPAVAMGEDTGLLAHARGGVVGAGFGAFMICKHTSVGHGHASDQRRGSVRERQPGVRVR